MLFVSQRYTILSGIAFQRILMNVNYPVVPRSHRIMCMENYRHYYCHSNKLASNVPHKKIFPNSRTTPTRQIARLLRRRRGAAGPAPGRGLQRRGSAGALGSPRLPSPRLHQLGLVVGPRGGRCRQQLLRLVLPDAPAGSSRRRRCGCLGCLQRPGGLRLGLLRGQLVQAAPAAAGRTGAAGRSRF